MVFKFTAHLLPYTLTSVSIALTPLENPHHEVFTSSLTIGLKFERLTLLHERHIMRTLRFR
jgi:hypothetical protein